MNKSIVVVNTRIAMNKRIIVGIFTVGCWWCLGAYRGIQIYNKKYESDCEKYEKNRKPFAPEYYYLSALGNGLFHSLFYINPCTLPIAVIEELYNAERAIRGIKNAE